MLSTLVSGTKDERICSGKESYGFTAKCVGSVQSISPSEMADATYLEKCNDVRYIFLTTERSHHILELHFPFWYTNVKLLYIIIYSDLFQNSFKLE